MQKKILVLIMIIALICNSNIVMAASTFSEWCSKKDALEQSDKVTDVFLGGSHTAAITENGDLYCWGDNTCGEVGDGTWDNQSKPVKVLQNVRDASIYLNRSAAITENGDLYTWGACAGNGVSEQAVPVKIMENVKCVQIGLYCTAAITNEGDLYMWGDYYGELSEEDRKFPTKVMENARYIHMDRYRGEFISVITEDDTLYCWGKNEYGEVGNGTTEECKIPIEVMGNVASVSFGFNHTAAITNSGDLYCWGKNTYGELGLNTTTNQLKPMCISEHIGVKAVVFEESCMYVLEKGGILYVWGVGFPKIIKQQNSIELVYPNDEPTYMEESISNIYFNSDGSLEILTTNKSLCTLEIVYNDGVLEEIIPMVQMSNVEMFVSSSLNRAVITTSGGLYCWGDNTFGQVGNGSYEEQLAPILVLGNTNSDTTTTPSSTSTPEFEEENKLQCDSASMVFAGSKTPLNIKAYENSLDELKALTKDIVWESEDTNIATVENVGFVLPTGAMEYSSENGTYKTWCATGMVYVNGVAKGVTTLTGTAQDGSQVVCQVSVAESPEQDTESGSGGSLTLGENQSGTGSSSVAEFFPANWSLKSTVFPVEISKSEGEKGAFTIRGTVGIGKSDWLDDDATWNDFKGNVEAAHQYTGSVKCLDSYRNKWGIKSMSAVSTDKFQVLPQLSVMGYFENTYDKNGNVVSSTGKLAADAEWSGGISWQFVTPIGPLYLNLSGSGKISGELGTTYDYNNKKLQIAEGSLTLTPSVSLEGGYGIDKVATIGAQGTLSVPITVVPASKGEFEASASLHVKLVFVIDYNHNLATYKTTLWDTTTQNKKAKNGNIVRISDGDFLEMDTSFSKTTGKWNASRKLTKRKATEEGKEYILSNDIFNLQEGILPSSLPIQAQIGDKHVMVFQSYDSSRTTLNSTILKYSVLEDGVWSEPKAVLDDGCADMYADMKVVNNQLVLVWQKMASTIKGDIETESESTLEEIAEKSEIYFSVFDETEESFISPIRITNNNYYDMMPKICENGTDVILSWVRNDAADLMQETGSNTIYVSKWNGSSFEEEKILNTASGTVEEYVVYQSEENLESIYIGVSNGIKAVFDTNGQVIDGLLTLMMESEDGDISSLRWNNGIITCICEGKLYSYDITTGMSESNFAGESAFGSELQYCSNGNKSGYIWSIYDEKTKIGSIVASMQTENGYCEPITICEEKGIMWRYFSPSIDAEGNWEIVANAENVETNINTLKYVTKKEENKLELMGAYIDEDNIVDGMTAVNFFAVNNQDTAIKNIEITITLENGDTVSNNIATYILPGESIADTVYMDLSGINMAQNVKISVVAENQVDKDNNIVSTKIGLSDISITATHKETNEGVEITATLSNQSVIDAETSLYLYDNEKMTKELQKNENVKIQAKNSSQIQFTVSKQEITYNENDAAYLTLKAKVLSGDFEEDNNVAYVILYRSDEEMSPIVTVAPTNSTNIPGISDASENNLSIEKQSVKANIGDVVVIKNMKYQVTKVKKDGTGEVTLIGTKRKKNDMKFSKLQIKNSILIEKKKFRVTAIGKKAFEGYKNLKKVIVGKNVSLIDKKAFNGCKKLKKIVIKTKLLKAGSIKKNAFIGIHKQVNIVVPKGILKKYKKIMQGGGIPTSQIRS